MTTSFPSPDLLLKRDERSRPVWEKKSSSQDYLGQKNRSFWEKREGEESDK